MQKGWSYIKDSGDFLKKIPNLGSIPENAILVMADVVGLYPSIPHEAGLKALREVILKNNYFEFNRHIKQQISGPAIGTTFAPPYACLFMDKIETAFLETQQLQPLVWFKYIDDIFFIWTHDIHQYLHYLSAHPNHTKRSVVFSQTLRITTLCSYEENFIKRKATMKLWFLKREYPERLIFAEMNKFKFSNIERRSNSKTKKGYTSSSDIPSSA